jgi:hypothetical protein
MKHGLNVVAIWIQDERRVIPGMIRTLSRCAVVTTARAQRNLMKSFDSLTIRGLEGKVHPGNWSVGRVDKQLIGIKESIAFDKNVRQAERNKDGTIETLVRLEIRHS